MAWFKRKKKGIQTPTEEKKDVPKGLWYKSPTGKVIDSDQLERNFYVSPEDGYHVRIGSREYFEIIFDVAPNIFYDLCSNFPNWVNEVLIFRDEFFIVGHSKHSAYVSSLNIIAAYAFIFFY